MERRFRNQLYMAIGLIFFFLMAGSVLYSMVEGWAFIDAFYFTGISLTTIGYGDLAPTFTSTKILSVVFGFLGIGLVFYSMNLLARKAFEREADQLEAMMQKRIQRKLAEEKKTKEEVEAEATRKAKELEKEATKIAKDLTKK